MASYCRSQGHSQPSRATILVALSAYPAHSNFPIDYVNSGGQWLLGWSQYALGIARGASQS